MELILSILGAAGLGHLAAEFFSQWEWMPDKPMKCNMCITFWLNVGPFIFLYGYEGVLYAALASIISELYLKILL
tara:strand:+ start:636 stop:860 length:225 start_codon:yes stop_codon:yes gene_type:complete